MIGSLSTVASTNSSTWPACEPTEMMGVCDVWSRSRRTRLCLATLGTVWHKRTRSIFSWRNRSAASSGEPAAMTLYPTERRTSQRLLRSMGSNPTVRTTWEAFMGISGEFGPVLGACLYNIAHVPQLFARPTARLVSMPESQNEQKNKEENIWRQV